MATLNLGRIKPIFRGAYAGGTAYVIDDIVTSGGSSYICILASTGNAVSNATYWTQMASGGTDVGTTITTQGDILYRDATGLARLGFGTSGKVLTTKGTGANPTWETAVGGKVLQCLNGFDHTDRSTSSTSFVDFSNTSKVTITPSATTSKILAFGGWGHYTNGEGYIYTTIYRDSTELSGDADGITKTYFPADGGHPHFTMYFDSPSSTSALVYSLYMRGSSGSRTHSIKCSYLTVMEIGA